MPKFAQTKYSIQTQQQINKYGKKNHPHTRTNLNTAVKKQNEISIQTKQKINQELYNMHVYNTDAWQQTCMHIEQTI
jgi:hypothetical protein